METWSSWLSSRYRPRARSGKQRDRSRGEGGPPPAATDGGPYLQKDLSARPSPKGRVPRGTQSPRRSPESRSFRMAMLTKRGQWPGVADDEDALLWRQLWSERLPGRVAPLHENVAFFADIYAVSPAGTNLQLAPPFPGIELWGAFAKDCPKHVTLQIVLERECLPQLSFSSSRDERTFLSAPEVASESWAATDGDLHAYIDAMLATDDVGCTLCAYGGDKGSAPTHVVLASTLVASSEVCHVAVSSLLRLVGLNDRQLQPLPHAAGPVVPGSLVAHQPQFADANGQPCVAFAVCNPRAAPGGAFQAALDAYATTLGSDWHYLLVPTSHSAEGRTPSPATHTVLWLPSTIVDCTLHMTARAVYGVGETVAVQHKLRQATPEAAVIMIRIMCAELADTKRSKGMNLGAKLSACLGTLAVLVHHGLWLTLSERPCSQANDLVRTLVAYMHTLLDKGVDALRLRGDLGGMPTEEGLARLLLLRRHQLARIAHAHLLPLDLSGMDALIARMAHAAGTSAHLACRRASSPG